MSFLINLVAFFLILGVLVFVHELGHFAVARWMGMRVDEFALGFPPRIWGRQYKGTLYAINTIPFGGYVKIHGENPENQDSDPNSFEKKSVWARIAVILAGVTMNILFAFVVLTVAFSVGFVSVTQDVDSVPNAYITHSEVLVYDILPGSAAEKAGLKPGDLILGFEENSQLQIINTVNQLVTYTKQHQASADKNVTIRYNRNGDIEKTSATLATDGTPLGVYIQPYNAFRVPVWEAPVIAVKEIGGIVQITWNALADFGHKLLFTAQLDPNVSGPVGIYKATGTATKAGAIPTIFLIVALSINLALLNVLPIPALDGGKFVFLIIEAVARRRIVSRRLENAITFAGFVLVIGLVLILSVRDVIHLF